MNKFTFFVALRYLFSKKKQNAINLISIISIIGIAVSTTALVCVLSVFNGLSSMVEKSFSEIDAELKISASTGKVFDISKICRQVTENKNIKAISAVLEDNALIDYDNHQTPVMLKGVDKNYSRVLNVDALIISGGYRLYDYPNFDVSVVGCGLAYQLNLGVDYINPLSIYVPVREGQINIARPDAAFKKGYIYVSGLFSSQQADYDNSVIIVPIEFVRQMLDYDSITATSLELKLKNTSKIKSTEKELQNAVGQDFMVENRYEQQKDYFKIIQGERLMIFIILSLILFIAVCNIISSLSIILIDKKDEITIFKNLGASQRQIKNIFIAEGWLMSILGAVAGVVVGLFICLLQQQIGFIRMGEAPFTENYPVAVQISDVVAVISIVLALGFISAFYPVKHFLIKNKY